MSQNDVKEATIALKGLLGITALEKSSESLSPSPCTTKYKDRKVSKETKTNDRKQRVKEPLNNKNEFLDRLSTEKTQQAQRPQLQTKTKNTKGVAGQSAHTLIKKKSSSDLTNRKITEKNFALSAFQSPPDASSLPMPSFHGNDDVSVKASIRGNDTERKDSRSVEENVTESRVSSLLMHVSSEKKIKQLLNISDLSVHDQSYSQDVASPNISYNNDRDSIATNISTSRTNSAIVSSEEKQHDEYDWKSTSDSGVNLAALASTTISTKDHMQAVQSLVSSLTISTQGSTNHHLSSPIELDPIAILTKGQSYGTANPALIHGTMHRPHHLQQFNPHQHGFMHHYDMGSHPYPLNPILQHPLTYTTIQVHVPPVLLPGRRMMLPASPLTGGYPLSIVVPEGMQPGMIMPVTIPTPPGHHIPLGFANNMTVPSLPLPPYHYHESPVYPSSPRLFNQQTSASSTSPVGESHVRTKSWAARVVESNKINGKVTDSNGTK